MEPKLEPAYDDQSETSFQNPSPLHHNFSYPDIASSSTFHFRPNPSSITLISPPTSIPIPLNSPSFLDDSSNVNFQTAFGMNNNVNEDSTILEDPKTITVPIKFEGNSQTQLSVPSRENVDRSRELGKVKIPTPEGMQDFRRNVVHKTLMVYDSLRVHVLAESEKNRSLVEANSQKKRTRGDLQATSLTTADRLKLHQGKRIVGSIPGVEVGDVYLSRSELLEKGLHQKTQAGIDYIPSSQSLIQKKPIATSVIVSGGYKDDEDNGNVIIYCGQGGQGKDQKQEDGNLALETSKDHGIEVRVIRGLKLEEGKVYVYDGLYRIVHSWSDIGKSGFKVYKYQLVRIENQPQMGSSIMRLAMTLRNRPKDYVTFDLSMQKENVPVLVFNDLDTNRKPISYEYLVTAAFPQIAHQGRNGVGCDCVGGCILNGCPCVKRNGEEFAYDNKGILIRGKPVVLECGPHCKCPPTCRNRVSQRGVKKRLEVYRKSGETGWGVRSLDMIRAGEFICEFSGVVLTHEQVEICTLNDDNLVYPGQFAEKWKEWGDMPNICSNLVIPSICPLDFAMDISCLRNVACYIGHSSSPNVFVQPVLYDHDNVCFPHLMLFAKEKIPPPREFSLDYGDDGEWRKRLAICG